MEEEGSWGTWGILGLWGSKEGKGKVEWKEVGVCWVGRVKVKVGVEIRSGIWGLWR